MYYCINPENLKNYLDDRFSKEKYRPTTEEVDSHTDLKAWCQSFKDSIFGTYFDEDLKNQIFQEVEKQKKKYDHALQCTQEYHHTIQEFFTEESQQNKFIAFETCMFILKEQNQVFKDFSLEQFIEGIKEMYTESPANFKIFLNQYFKENFSFYDQGLIDKTYQMIEKIRNTEQKLNDRIARIKEDNEIISDMENEEIKQALFQISQKDQKENTEELKGVLVKLIPETKDKQDVVEDTCKVVQLLSQQKAA
ncbi:hypothetical protein IJM86_07275 [bacterium]|nr:hypothetical protein [bacterium]